MSDNGLPLYPQQPLPHQGNVIGWQPIFAAPPKPPFSGARIATGIVAIVASMWTGIAVMYEMSTWRNEAVLEIILLGFLGSTATFILGIVQLATSRSRKTGVPIALLSLSAIGVIISGTQISEMGLAVLWTINMLFCLAVTILAAVVLVQGVKSPAPRAHHSRNPQQQVPTYQPPKLR